MADTVDSKSMAQVFQMAGGEWFAATSEDEALKAMAACYGYEETPEGIAAMKAEFEIEPGYPFALSDEDLEKKTIYVERDDDGFGETLSLHAYLDELVAENSIPCFFGCMEA
ncbi:MAG TPA: hypothetical protein VHB45_13080 [Alloacidobacterium sp.]|nr:hypothetical protein [Alloacidobacterium sp.]